MQIKEVKSKRSGNMFSSIKHLGAKAKGLFEHKDPDHHEHDVGEVRKSIDVISETSNDENAALTDHNGNEAEKVTEKAEKKRKLKRNRYAFEPHTSFDF